MKYKEQPERKSVRDKFDIVREEYIQHIANLTHQQKKTAVYSTN
jgi:hypothetical protein